MAILRLTWDSEKFKINHFHSYECELVGCLLWAGSKYQLSVVGGLKSDSWISLAEGRDRSSGKSSQPTGDSFTPGEILSLLMVYCGRNFKHVRHFAN